MERDNVMRLKDEKKGLEKEVRRWNKSAAKITRYKDRMVRTNKRMRKG